MQQCWIARAPGFAQLANGADGLHLHGWKLIQSGIKWPDHPVVQHANMNISI
jgi:hypothetical protein